MKTKVYNLIILDESGSMHSVKKQTIGGCNETINSIKSSQEMYGDTQDHYVSIYAFQSDSKIPSRYIVKNIDAMAARHITDDDYQPYGCTPLLDAVGSTLSELKAVLPQDSSALASVTIITDGMENSSRHYTYHQVKNLIEQLKERGWNFNFIGANIDAAGTAAILSIDNHLQFESTPEGTHAMWNKFNGARAEYMADICMSECHPDMSEEDKINLRKSRGRKFFSKD